MRSTMDPMTENPIQRTVKTAHLSVPMTVQRASVHNTTQNSSDNLPSYLQTNIVAQTLPIGGRRNWHQQSMDMLNANGCDLTKTVCD